VAKRIPKPRIKSPAVSLACRKDHKADDRGLSRVGCEQIASRAVPVACLIGR
jgi:hypothetical protein